MDLYISKNISLNEAQATQTTHGTTMWLTISNGFPLFCTSRTPKPHTKDKLAAKAQKDKSKL